MLPGDALLMHGLELQKPLPEWLAGMFNHVPNQAWVVEAARIEIRAHDLPQAAATGAGSDPKARTKNSSAPAAFAMKPVQLRWQEDPHAAEKPSIK